MAFILSGTNVVSYAEALDVRDKDQRLFESNEIDFTNVPDAPADLNEYIEDLTTKTTDRINTKIRLSARWREYLNQTGSISSVNDIPVFNPDRIVGRKADFTWFDSDGDGTVEDGEKQIRFRLTRRSRSRKAVARVK